jgi:hypothetical protein
MRCQNASQIPDSKMSKEVEFFLGTLTRLLKNKLPLRLK